MHLPALYFVPPFTVPSVPPPLIVHAHRLIDNEILELGHLGDREYRGSCFHTNVDLHIGAENILV